MMEIILVMSPLIILCMGLVVVCIIKEVKSR